MEVKKVSEFVNVIADGEATEAVEAIIEEKAEEIRRIAELTRIAMITCGGEAPSEGFIAYVVSTLMSERFTGRGLVHVTGRRSVAAAFATTLISDDMPLSMYTIEDNQGYANCKGKPAPDAARRKKWQTCYGPRDRRR